MNNQNKTNSTSQNTRNESENPTENRNSKNCR